MGLGPGARRLNAPAAGLGACRPKALAVGHGVRRLNTTVAGPRTRRQRGSVLMR